MRLVALPGRSQRRRVQGVTASREIKPRYWRRRLSQAGQHPLSPAGSRRSGALLGAGARARPGQRDRPHQPGLGTPGAGMISRRQPAHAEAAPPTAEQLDREFEELTKKISLDRGFACASYKEKCLRRRIAVRMRARGVHTYADYARVLDSDHGEYDRLLDALTINVTKLFRNRSVYEALAEHVVPALWNSGERSIHVWSAGCSSGEEPYSLAILFHRYAA